MTIQEFMNWVATFPKEINDEKGKIIITNQSGVRLEPRLLQDKDGDYFVILGTDLTFVKNNEPLVWPINFNKE